MDTDGLVKWLILVAAVVGGILTSYWLWFDVIH